jgi:heptosyltransferase I
MSAVLVIRPSSLGDIVHALALVADVRRHRPEIAVDWVAEEAFSEIVALDPDVRRVIPVALRRWRHSPFSPTTWREIAGFRRTLRRDGYAAVLDLQEQVKGALIAKSARGVRHGPDRRSIREPVATLAHDVHHPIDPAQHLIDRCRELAGRALGYRVEGPPRFHFEAPPPDAGVALPDRPYVVALHATSRASKLWPEAHWRQLLADLARAGFTTLLPWGDAAERARSDRLAADSAAASAPPRMALAGLATLLSRAELVVGVDTGLVHLAAALGTPTIALFVATDPALAGVARTGAHARDLGGIAEVPSVAAVLETANALLRLTPRC